MEDELYNNMTESERDVLELSIDYCLWESAGQVIKDAEKRIRQEKDIKRKGERCDERKSANFTKIITNG